MQHQPSEFLVILELVTAWSVGPLKSRQRSASGNFVTFERKKAAQKLR